MTLYYSHSSGSGHCLLVWFIAEMCMMPCTLMRGLEPFFSLDNVLSFTTNTSVCFAKGVCFGSFYLKCYKWAIQTKFSKWCWMAEKTVSSIKATIQRLGFFWGQKQSFAQYLHSDWCNTVLVQYCNIKNKIVVPELCLELALHLSTFWSFPIKK